ncbi:MAG: 3-oxoacyl-ACP synthase [Bacteroidetes bacterium RBG_13_42_15]|nr:MAG: 3-oxoacyl-ACP synthase [Bacteroidetes bacterium RBG_13_42_15]HJX71861.1 ketoacyl-ACP synthase III [Bacteroidales bacterium]
MKKIYSVITGTGCYIPEKIVKNADFLNHIFYDEQGNRIDKPSEEIIKKFEEITDIKERRYVKDDQVASDIAYLAALDALDSANIDRETLDYIIVAHNFGDIRAGSSQTDILPSLASRVKEKLGIKNHRTISYDATFGCPGWLQAIIHADYFLKSGDAKRALAIGTDTLSRLCDPYDRDSMIYADGAGAVILEAVESEEPVGILSHSFRTDTNGNTYNLWLGKSNKPDYKSNELFIKMKGRKIYEYALNTVPVVVKESLDKAGVMLRNVNKVLIHQANAKMDDAILQRIFKQHREPKIPDFIMPMTITKLGNSSVATIPTMLNLILTGRLDGHAIESGDIAIFVSVGAGMNINSVIYKFPES